MKAIDLFAGAGGFTQGAEQAGAEVIWAANHWNDAVEIHERNHPDALHACQDLHQTDWSTVPSMDVVLASPACQGHTKARGKERAHHDATRSTAWAVVSCVEFHRPEFAIVENVPEFLDWALYPAWASAMQALGYTMAHEVLDAADFGVPQNRRRLFIVASRSRTAHHLDLPRVAHVPARSFIDLNAGNWTAVNKPGRAQATLDRVAAGRAAFGDTFLAPYYGSGSGATGRSLDRPIGTITTRERWSLVHEDRMRMLTLDETVAAMGFPSDYELPSAKKRAVHMLGNAVCPPVAEALVRSLR